MVRVAYIDVPPDVRGVYDKTFTPLYKTKNSSLRWGGGISSPRKKFKTSTKSLLPQIRDLWNGLTLTEQHAWKEAALNQSYNAWNGFVQDTAYRLKYGISGLATPSDLHMYKCGHINIASPAVKLHLIQEHPVEHFVMKKVRGTKSQYYPFAIEEVLTLPLIIALSYRANLTAAGPNPYARFYASVTRSYQALDLAKPVGFDLPFVCDWQRQETGLAGVVGLARWYSLNIELNDVRGILEFDTVKAFHSGTNYARDFRCNNIDAGFSNYNYQLPPSWEAVEAVAGATYGSLYPIDGSL